MQRTDLRKSADAATNSILFEGANLTQLSQLFGCDERTLKEKMHGIMPVGKRYNANIYKVSEVAERMGKLTVKQIDAAMRRMHHNDLPKLLSKEYWNGRVARQKFEEAEGNLWRTEKVIEVLSEVAKTLKMELDLLIDGIERNTQLTNKQRDIAISLVDGAKNNMVKKLQEQFGEKKPKAKVIDSSPIWTDEDDEDDDDDL